VKSDKILESIETPDGDVEEWTVTFKEGSKLKIEISKVI
jgi:hypothetical protein